MKQVENLSIDETIQALQENELGFLLLQGKPPNMYSILSEQVSDSEHSCLIGTTNTIHYSLFPLYYYNQQTEETGDLVRPRMHAIWALFDRWTLCGYNKHHAKKPYGCKSFMNWLEEQDYMQADYLLLWIDPEE